MRRDYANRRAWSGVALVSAVWILIVSSAFDHACAERVPGFKVGMTFSRVHDPMWFPQRLDHFNALDTRTFQQRYWIDNSHFSDHRGPVFLYICGEAECGGIPSGYLQDAATRFNALITVLEHRFYGETVVFAEHSTENLVFLSSKQAANDLAVFATFVREQYNLPSTHPFVLVGGSYPGALSYWTRLKFPHIFRASWSSSGVVNAIYDFTAFDDQIVESAGPECAAVLRNATHLIEQEMLRSPSDNARIKTLFGADPSDFEDDGDFYFMLADSAALAFQYGYPDKVCVPMLAAAKARKDLIQAFADYTKSFFYPTFCPGIGPRSYSTVLQQVTAATPQRNERQWAWQTCSELAYFQNWHNNNSIRSRFVDMDYQLRHCKKVFGVDMIPDTVGTNIYYGATNVAETNVFFANGSQDPWKRASVLNTSFPATVTRSTTCYNCGHCVDLRGCPGGCTDDASLQVTRNLINEFLAVVTAK